MFGSPAFDVTDFRFELSHSLVFITYHFDPDGERSLAVWRRKWQCSCARHSRSEIPCFLISVPDAILHHSCHFLTRVRRSRSITCAPPSAWRHVYISSFNLRLQHTRPSGHSSQVFSASTSRTRQISHLPSGVSTSQDSPSRTASHSPEWLPYAIMSLTG